MVRERQLEIQIPSLRRQRLVLYPGLHSEEDWQRAADHFRPDGEARHQEVVTRLTCSHVDRAPRDAEIAFDVVESGCLLVL